MSKLTEWQNAIKLSYPKFQAINPEKAKTELGFALQIFQNNAMLQKCEPTTIINAVVNVARTSITLNPVLRLAYLVPRGNKCVLDFSYMGMVALLKDNGCIKYIDAHIVYGDEDFDFNIAENKITHKPNYSVTEQEHNSRTIIGCYTRAVLPCNDIVYEFMPYWEIEKVKKSSTNANSKYSAWVTWKDEMIKKTVIKRHFKMLINAGGQMNNDKLSALLEIENENNPMKNDFNKKSSFTTAFIEEPQEEEVIQLDEIIEGKPDKIVEDIIQETPTNISERQRPANVGEYIYSKHIKHRLEKKEVTDEQKPTTKKKVAKKKADIPKEEPKPDFEITDDEAEEIRIAQEEMQNEYQSGSLEEKQKGMFD